MEQWERVVVTVSAARQSEGGSSPEGRAAVPVTVLTGVLGAGKTTLLRRLLAGDHGLRISAVVNDVADLGLDASLIEGVTDDVVALTNGCSCCTLAGDLAAALRDLAAPGTGPAPDAVIIELSGASDPVSVAQVVQGAPGVCLDGVVAVVDAEQGRSQLADHRLGPVMHRQLAAAHLVVISKADLVDGAAEDALVAAVGAVAPGRPVVVLRATHEDVGLLLGAGLKGARPTPPDEGDHGGVAEVVTRIVAVPPKLPRAAASAWLDRAPQSVVRAKGWVSLVGPNGAIEVLDLQLVGRRWALEGGTAPVDVPLGTVAVIAFDETGMQEWLSDLSALSEVW